jgi:hypothetical protein
MNSIRAFTIAILLCVTMLAHAALASKPQSRLVCGSGKNAIHGKWTDAPPAVTGHQSFNGQACGYEVRNKRFFLFRDMPRTLTYRTYHHR